MPPLSPILGGQGLLALLAHGLVAHAITQTRATLGDRRRYVGLSDVGKGVVCLRAAAADKLAAGSGLGSNLAAAIQSGDWGRVQAILGRQLVLQRGHWLEAGVEAAYRAAGTPFLTQLEIAPPDLAVPLRAHLDFVLFRPGPRPAVRIVELKSTAHIPATLYPGYETQLYGQLGLLQRHWRQPVFTQGGETAPFPELVRRSLGLSLPEDPSAVDLDGFVLCLSMDDARAFGPYHPSEAMTALVERIAGQIWSGFSSVARDAATLDDLSLCSGFHPLCDFCAHATGCPKYACTSISDPAVDTELAAYLDMKARRAALDTELEGLEARIRRFCSRAGDHLGWFSTTRFRFKTARIAGRKSLDSIKLKVLLEDYLDPQILENIFDQATRTGADFERLSVQAVSP